MEGAKRLLSSFSTSFVSSGVKDHKMYQHKNFLVTKISVSGDFFYKIPFT